MKMKMTALMLCLCLLAVGCGKKEETVTVDLTQLADALLTGLTFQEELIELDASMAEQLYGLEADKFTKQIIYASSGATSDEVILLEAGEETDMEEVKALLEQRVSDQKDNFESYRPDQMEAINHAVIKINGRYAALVICGNWEGAEKILEEAGL